MATENIQKLARSIAQGNTVFFGGAGVSTESGIPDFRSAGGVYGQKSTSGVTPEEMLSRDFFMKSTAEFYSFYTNNLIFPGAKPNFAHLSLARLEQAGLLTAVITQNVDGLHQAAGSQNVIELHGSVARNSCTKCGSKHSLGDVLAAKGSVPKCRDCGGVVKPDVTLYGEMLDDAVTEAAISAIAGAKTLIIGGTSLAVYPAAMYVTYFEGDMLCLINKSRTPYDHSADVIIREGIGGVLASVYAELGL